MKASAVFFWAGVACLVVIAAFTGYFLLLSENADILAYFAVGCVFILAGLVTFISLWSPPDSGGRETYRKGRDE